MPKAPEIPVFWDTGVHSREKNSREWIESVHSKPVPASVGDYQIHCYFDLFTNIDHYAPVQSNALNLHNYEVDRENRASYFPVIWKKEVKGLLHWEESPDGTVLEYIRQQVTAK